MIDNLPAAQVKNAEANPNLRVLSSETGAWQPFTMRVDQAPFDDVRVRQAFRLIVDREQMVQQVLSGHGARRQRPLRPLRPGLRERPPHSASRTSSRPSRCSSKPGQEGLRVELVTAPVFQGIVEAAQVFARAGQGRGRRREGLRASTRARSTATTTSHGRSRRTSGRRACTSPRWPRATCPSRRSTRRTGRPTRASSARSSRPAPRPTRRGARTSCSSAQTLQYEEGGYIIQYFSNIIDAYSAKLGGFVEAKCGFPFGNCSPKNVGFLA